MAAVGSSLRSRKLGTKHTLSTPYELNWPMLQTGDNKAILDEIRRVFPHSLLHRGSSRKKVDLGSKDMDDTKSKEDERLKRECRSCLAVGINEVTRALERGQLSLALVCRTVKPNVLISHLRLLSATRGTPICAVHGLGETLAPILGIKKVAACGFKKSAQESYFESLVDFIKVKTPEISIPWLKLWKDEDGGLMRLQKSAKRRNLQHRAASEQALHCDSNTVTGENEKTIKVDSAETCSIRATGDEDVVKDLKTEQINKRRHSKQGDGSKRMRLENVAVEYQAPNIKTLKVEGKKKKKKKDKGKR